MEASELESEHWVFGSGKLIFGPSDALQSDADLDFEAQLIFSRSFSSDYKLLEKGERTRKEARKLAQEVVASAVVSALGELFPCAYAETTEKINRVSEVWLEEILEDIDINISEICHETLLIVHKQMMELPIEFGSKKPWKNNGISKKRKMNKKEKKNKPAREEPGYTESDILSLWQEYWLYYGDTVTELHLVKEYGTWMELDTHSEILKCAETLGLADDNYLMDSHKELVQNVMAMEPDLCRKILDNPSEDMNWEELRKKVRETVFEKSRVEFGAYYNVDLCKFGMDFKDCNPTLVNGSHQETESVNGNDVDLKDETQELDRSQDKARVNKKLKRVRNLMKSHGFILNSAEIKNLNGVCMQSGDMRFKKSANEDTYQLNVWLNTDELKQKNKIKHDVDDFAYVHDQSQPTTIMDVADFKFRGDDSDSHLVASRAPQLNPTLRKYWYQRYRLFSKFDHGILMDVEGWYSVTPEAIAKHMAEKIVGAENKLIVDAFCGVGGNSIQFALQGAYVIAVDIDPVKIKCALANSKVYGVEAKILFLCMDFLHAAQFLKADAVFLSPPWGGPQYLKETLFDLETMLTPNGFTTMQAAAEISKNIALFVPKNSSSEQLSSFSALTGGKMEVEQNILNGKLKTITAYYGELVVEK